MGRLLKEISLTVVQLLFLQHLLSEISEIAAGRPYAVVGIFFNCPIHVDNNNNHVTSDNKNNGNNNTYDDQSSNTSFIADFNRISRISNKTISELVKLYRNHGELGQRTVEPHYKYLSSVAALQEFQFL